MLTYLTRAPRHLLMLIDTVIHEVGHTVALLPLGTSLSIRVRADGTGVTHGSTGVLGDGWFAAPARILNLFAGYAAPVLFGLFIALTAWQETVVISGWWPVVVVLWLLAAVLTTLHLTSAGVLVLLGSWVGVVLALANAPAPVNTTQLTGAELVLWLLFYVGAVITLSIRSLFTLVAAALWLAVAWLLSLPVTNPDSQAAGVWLLVVFGAVIFFSGVFSIIGISRSTVTGGGSDFHLLSKSFGGATLGWFITFLVLLTAAVVVTLVLFFNGITT